MADKKKKKQKTVYVDDGRTIADMSALGEKRIKFGSGAPSGGKSHGTLKDHMRTYFNACKTMFLPMLATMGIICIAFLILYLILELAA